MIELPHALVGAAIAAKVGNPYIALPLALASHFVLDVVPHWNPHLNREIAKYGKITNKTKVILVFDVLASLAGGFYIASTALPDTNRFLIILMGAFLGVLPDLAEAPYFLMGLQSKWIKKLVAFQSSIQFNVPIIPGILSQVVTIAAAWWWVFKS